MHRMKHREHMAEMKCMMEDMMKDTARTLNDVRCNIEESIINHDLMPGKIISETPDNLVVELLMPGVKKENISLEISEREIKVEITIDVESYLKGGFISFSEKRTGIIKRKVSLPMKVIPDEAKAKLERGILKIEMPKLEKDESVNVNIE